MKAVTIFCAALAAGALAQTPPIQPQTPDIRIPPLIELPGPAISIGKQPLQLSEAVLITLKNQPQISIARGNLISAQGRKGQALSGLLPQASGTASASDVSQLRGQSVSASPSRFAASISIEQLLFDFGRTRDSVRQQSSLERAFQLALLRTQQTVILDTKRAFYDLLQNIALVGIAQANVANRKRQLDLAQARLDSGFGPPSDVVRAKTNLADGVIALESARNSELNSRVALAQALGIDPRTPITPQDTSESALDNENDVEALAKTAMDARPDVLESRARVSAAEYAVSSASKSNLPTLNATASVSGRGPNDPFASESGSVGVSIAWTFWDSGLAAGRIKETRGQEEVARASLQQISQQAVAEVAQSYVDLKSALQRENTAQAQLANAAELLRISEGRYAGGIGQFLEVTDAQSSLVAAQRNVAQARQDVSRARARLKAAIGSSQM